ncbi:hypothetical protein MKW98_028407 [Papaver atlanticum]|uniref:FAS1 domain-containing protein n=1 Tax=Papaver atlanticum TaxID=357466 RepID=A0AAD4SY91_9MAGN|nr:hypothetical protein MKW98_028407 [Papaver atlanticum]
MACSCSHWWHAPIYMTITVILAIVAVSPPNPKTHNPPPSIQHEISSNASLALRNSGFHFMATLLQISPELILSSSSSSTFFAIRDETISNLSLPPRLLKDLLKFHTFPSKFTIQDLLNKPENTCLQTLLQGKNLTVTKIDRKQSIFEINGVLISDPGIFNQGPYIIHGVLKPFSPINLHLGFDHFIQSSNCGSISNGKSRTRVSWNGILRTLSSNGFVSFAIGLNSVLNDEVHIKKLNMMNSVTIFAPAELSYVASSPSPLLEKIVMIHLVPGRWSYKQLLAASSAATTLTTLVPDIDLQITKVNSSTAENEEILSVNGVEITAPDVLHSNGCIIHQISRPIGMAKLSPLHVRSISG